MAARGAKEALVNKLGFKSSSSRSAESEMEKLKRENEVLKRSVEQMKRSGKHSDPDRAKLLERILSLETLREKNTQQLLDKDQEMSKLRQQLRETHGDVVSSLQEQLQHARTKEIHYQALAKETEDLKNKYCVVSQRCEELEKHKTQVQSGELSVVQEQLKDALEKNQSWLVYDQQREAFVQGLLVRTTQLETQLNDANQALLQHKEADSKGESGQMLEAEQTRAGRIQAELDDVRKRYEEKGREVTEIREQLQEEMRSSREERKSSAERVNRLHYELKTNNDRLEEERKRVSELLQQVNVLQTSRMKQQEEQKRLTLLEQQVKLSAKESENEKLDRQTLQHQLHKVLKELRKARDQIARLESSKQQRDSRFSEPSSYNRMGFERLTIEDRTTSPSKGHNLLDESILECPNCGASYPTSQHRELLAHLDYCFN